MGKNVNERSLIVISW